MARLITPDELIPQPDELVRENGEPDTIDGWKELVDGLLMNQSCVFHRNLEISSRYAWMYKFLPAYLKWAGMAAFASHHVRLALFPLRLDRNRTGYVDIPHSLGRRKVLLMTDVNAVREKEMLLTGMSREGTFLVEDGKITRPLRDVRFTDSVLRLLSATEALTREPRLVSEGEYYGRRFAHGVVCPALRADGFRVTGATT